MKRFFAVLMAIASLGTTGCHEVANIRHIHENPYRREMTTLMPRFTTLCSSTACTRVIYINGDCLVTDGTNVLPEIDVLVNTRLCIYNQSGCELTIKFDARLFGESSYTVAADGCVNLTVKEGARGQDYTTEFICTNCAAAEGGGHTNPDVKVGDDEEP
jgi:hypothetical protein